MNKICKIIECDKPTRRRGWCEGHYKRWWRHGDPLGGRRSSAPGDLCTIDDCDLPRFARDWCRKHYARWWRHGDPLGGQQRPSHCTINGCNRKHSALDLCSLHYAHQRTKQLKKEVLAHYGSECVCCGEADAVFLTLDHINNDGAADRRGPHDTGTYFYVRIKREGFPTNLQVLCFNCNIAKGHNAGVCPHQE